MTHQTNYIVRLIDNTLKIFKHELELHSLLLTSLDYNNVLKHGFVMIKGEDGRFLSSKLEANKLRLFKFCEQIII